MDETYEILDYLSVVDSDRKERGRRISKLEN